MSSPGMNRLTARRTNRQRGTWSRSHRLWAAHSRIRRIDQDSSGRVRTAEFILPSATWGCYLMAPFVGRIRGGLVEFGGRQIALQRNFGAHAIHGAVFDVPWQVERSGRSAVTLMREIDRERWPFGGVVRQQ